VLPYESLLSCASIDKKIKEKKKKRILNNNLAVLPSHDSLPQTLLANLINHLINPRPMIITIVSHFHI